MPYDHVSHSQACPRELPPELERKLQLCEGIVERMRVLQEQVDQELRQPAAPPAPPDMPYEGGPAVRLAVNSVLRWILQNLKPDRG